MKFSVRSFSGVFLNGSSLLLPCSKSRIHQGSAPFSGLARASYHLAMASEVSSHGIPPPDETSRHLGCNIDINRWRIAYEFLISDKWNVFVEIKKLQLHLSVVTAKNGFKLNYIPTHFIIRKFLRLIIHLRNQFFFRNKMNNICYPSK